MLSTVRPRPKQVGKSGGLVDLGKTVSDKGRVMFKYLSKPNRKDSITFLKRQEQVIIFRLRTAHIQLNAHLSRITEDHNPTCTLCGYKEETVKHFLFDCPPLKEDRKEFLPPNPDLENTLYSNVSQLQQTCKYFHKANKRRTQVRAWFWIKKVK